MPRRMSHRRIPPAYRAFLLLQSAQSRAQIAQLVVEGFGLLVIAALFCRPYLWAKGLLPCNRLFPGHA